MTVVVTKMLTMMMIFSGYKYSLINFDIPEMGRYAHACLCLFHRNRVKPVSYTHLDVYKRQHKGTVINIWEILQI